MDKQFVTDDIAIKLYEKGYTSDNQCLGFYYYDGSINKYRLVYDESSEGYSKTINAPLWQQVIDWFAEVHHIDIEPIMNWRWKDDNEDDAIRVYSYNILKQVGTRIEYLTTTKNGLYNTRAKAIEEAIKKALTII